MALPTRTTSLTCLLAAAFVVWASVDASAQTRGGTGSSQQPPVLTAFTINVGADTVSSAVPTVALTHTVVGATPSEYRVSHRADFAGGSWLPYASPLILRDWYDGAGEPCLPAGPSHRVTLYLQVRATVGEEVRIVDGQRQLVPARVESNVLRATICARAGSSAPRGAIGP